MSGMLHTNTCNTSKDSSTSTNIRTRFAPSIINPQQPPALLRPIGFQPSQSHYNNSMSPRQIPVTSDLLQFLVEAIRSYPQTINSDSASDDSRIARPQSSFPMSPMMGTGTGPTGEPIPYQYYPFSQYNHGNPQTFWPTYDYTLMTNIRAASMMAGTNYNHSYQILPPANVFGCNNTLTIDDIDGSAVESSNKDSYNQPASTTTSTMETLTEGDEHQEDMVATETTTHINRRQNHSRKKVYPCPFADCDYVSNQKANIAVHIRHHTGEKPFHCSFPGCSFSSAQQSNLRTHEKIHTGVRPWKCDVEGCVYAATHRNLLPSHKMRAHGISAAGTYFQRNVTTRSTEVTQDGDLESAVASLDLKQHNGSDESQGTTPTIGTSTVDGEPRTAPVILLHMMQPPHN